jgi:hypothetical protein
MNNKTKKNRNIHGGARDNSDIKLYIYRTSKISTDPNVDPNYRKVGIVHYSDSAGINIVRGFGTGISNIFGAKGFDNTVYDTLRKQTLEKVKGLLTDNQIICSCRMEFDIGTPSMIIHHFYGTLYEKEKKL